MLTQDLLHRLQHARFLQVAVHQCICTTISTADVEGQPAGFMSTVCPPNVSLTPARREAQRLHAEVVDIACSIGHALPDSRLGGWAGRLPAVQGLRPVLPPLHAAVFSLLAEHQVMIAHACIASLMQPGLNLAQLVSLRSPG
jgi:hypothetical protein